MPEDGFYNPCWIRIRILNWISILMSVVQVSEWMDWPCLANPNQAGRPRHRHLKCERTNLIDPLNYNCLQMKIPNVRGVSWSLKERREHGLRDWLAQLFASLRQPHVPKFFSLLCSNLFFHCFSTLFPNFNIYPPPLPYVRLSSLPSLLSFSPSFFWDVPVFEPSLQSTQNPFLHISFYISCTKMDWRGGILALGDHVQRSRAAGSRSSFLL